MRTFEALVVAVAALRRCQLHPGKARNQPNDSCFIVTSEKSDSLNECDHLREGLRKKPPVRERDSFLETIDSSRSSPSGLGLLIPVQTIGDLVPVGIWRASNPAKRAYPAASRLSTNEQPGNLY